MVFVLILILLAWLVLFLAALLLRTACNLLDMTVPGVLRSQGILVLALLLGAALNVGFAAASGRIADIPGIPVVITVVRLVLTIAVLPAVLWLLLPGATWIKGLKVQVLVLVLAIGFVGLIPVSAFVSLLAIVFMVAPGPKVPFRYNLRNLQVRWKTSLVTALAFTLVVALLTVMLAFVKGMDKLTEGSGIPGNVLILADGATDEAFSNLPRTSVQLLPSEIQELIEKNDKGEFLATQEVYVIVAHNIPHAEKGGRKRRFVQMRGLDNAEIAAQVHEIKLAAGTWFSPAGVREIEYVAGGKTVRSTATEVVLGDGIAKTFGSDLGRETLVPGDIVDIGERWWYVVGVMEPSNSAFGSEIWAKDTPVGERFGRVNSYSSYVVRTRNEEIAKAATKLIKEYRSERAMQAYTEREYYARLTQTNDQFRFAIMFVAVIMAVGGVLGVMNTMFAAISQRTKDIGVMRLLGFTRWQILCSFLVESLLIALVGGLLGLFLGSFFDGATASSIVSSGAGGGGKSVVLRLTVDSSVLSTGLVFTFFMGAVGGLLPSLSAMRLKPLESLR